MGTMTEEGERTRFREHLHEMREALGGLGRDVVTDVEHAPRVAKEETRNVFAKAAGIRRGPLHEWDESVETDSK